ncbi:lytic polysaccharide monooxygenase [Hypholoma sublateritium FD-334 SS-4]|uniref:AA9 family lytic polysaccharide monooxygenase n=1 Tax=Hypholoma sublateritium (strain FD-334 SS-4) TaxID=945553 RepID=A0A0D2N880_HYPSF|nr:lytic polysaccharide monooxygenase [Hypholoma sublateritium FD-334 SS-4]
MKCFAILSAVILSTQSVSAHYIFKTLVAGSKTSTQAVRQPQNNEPIHDITSAGMTCNVDPGSAGETVSVAAGDTIGFQLDTAMYHEGPVSIYLGKAPGTAADWDGSGSDWFKIAEWGASSFAPMKFSSYELTTFTTTIPTVVPSGEYLARIENIALHLGTGVPEIFVSCAQISVTGGGSGNPSKVAIPGYVGANDPSVVIDIYNSKNTTYTVPGPEVYRG